MFVKFKNTLDIKFSLTKKPRINSDSIGFKNFQIFCSLPDNREITILILNQGAVSNKKFEPLITIFLGPRDLSENFIADINFILCSSVRMISVKTAGEIFLHRSDFFSCIDNIWSEPCVYIHILSIHEQLNNFF